MKKYIISICLLVACCTFNGCKGPNKSMTKESQPTSAQSIAEGIKKMSRETFASGLIKEITVPGAETAVQPAKGKRISVHYTGWLNENGVPGRKFDSSVDRGTPFVFVVGVGQVIRGWDEGLMRMKRGEKARLFIPAELGYGARGAGAAIPPNANLIFDVELLEIL